MTKKLFCGGLPWAATDDDLTQAMSGFGVVTEAKVIMDRETGKSKGFGFVTFSSEEEAQTAIQAGSIDMMGRTVRLDEATDRQRGGGGGGRSGGQGDRGGGDRGGGFDDRDGGGRRGKGRGRDRGGGGRY